MKRTRSSWDHPRSRGVYAPASPAAADSEGSSPLARGLPTRYLTGGHGSGIIPARAGFTERAAVRQAMLRDHPRSRGVYVIPGRVGGTELGSSPLARGLLAAGGNIWLRGGIIPARAGFTFGWELAGSGAWDHPRSRGVYGEGFEQAVSDGGSSPLARGLRLRAGGRDTGARIIPARAGFTRRDGWSRRGRRDHPRSRGVYGGEMAAHTHLWGSSPLARGLLAGGHEPAAATGIIPARAGFTGGR